MEGAYVNDHKKLDLKVMPFFSMVDKRKKLHADTISSGPEEIKGLLRASIPYLSIVESMGVKRAPVGVFAPASSAAAAFQALWSQVAVKAQLAGK